MSPEFPRNLPIPFVRPPFAVNLLLEMRLTARTLLTFSALCRTLTKHKLECLHRRYRELFEFIVEREGLIGGILFYMLAIVLLPVLLPVVALWRFLHPEF
jgi:hypothetical protein